MFYAGLPSFALVDPILFCLFYQNSPYITPWHFQPQFTRFSQFYSDRAQLVIAPAWPHINKVYRS